MPACLRLKVINDVFGDFTDFVRIGGVPNNCRIITRQERVKGREALMWAYRPLTAKKAGDLD